MPTFLFDSIIFGPVHSRRLGVSLGINLLPVNGKVCSFDCLYCECGLNASNRGGKIPSGKEVLEALEKKLREMQEAGTAPDVLTFAGNGEPTLHPEFASITEGTLELRNRFFPKAKVSVLSNATQLEKPKVREALLKVDQAILKLDSAFDETVRLIDRPVSGHYSVSKIVGDLCSMQGKLIIQTLFVRGSYQGKTFDNTTANEISAWIELLKVIKPESVMIYAIDRDTPVSGLVKISVKELQAIAAKVKAETGTQVSVAS